MTTTSETKCCENRNLGAECSTKTENKFFINEYFQDGKWLLVQSEYFLSKADAIRCRPLTNRRGDKLEIRTVTLARELNGKSYEDLTHELYEKDMEVEDLKMQIDYWKGKVR